MGDEIKRWPVDIEGLRRRVEQFNRMELPGQPRAMHVGTSYLISDLWRAVEQLSELRLATLAGSGRYWEGRWRDEHAENERLRQQLGRLERDR